MRFPESKREAAVNKTKLKRLATVEVSCSKPLAIGYLTLCMQDVAQQVRTLALSQSTTGQNINLDGGSTV